MKHCPTSLEALKCVEELLDNEASKPRSPRASGWQPQYASRHGIMPGPTQILLIENCKSATLPLSMISGLARHIPRNCINKIFSTVKADTASARGRSRMVTKGFIHIKNGG